MYIWIIILIISGLVEVATASLVSIWFVVGALVSMILTFANFSMGIQILGFILGSLFTFIVIRPRLIKYIRSPKIATNNDKLIGQLGEVVDEIGELENGKVKIQGQIWTARSLDGKSINLGELVLVEGIEGVKLLVKKGGVN